jgi:putative inorganic carbon (hco3(-)) transporter
MNTRPSLMSRAALALTFASATSILFSIAASQILLALALVCLLLSGDPLRLPRIKWLLGIFMLGTVISLAFSAQPALGLPQIRKFYVFLELLVVFSCLREIASVRALFLTWAGFGSIAALRGIYQFAAKMQQAHQAGKNAYDYYVAERITGFTNHWVTFSAEQMYALIMLGAFLLFAPGIAKRKWVWIACAALMGLAVLLAETRGVWIGTAVAALYLVWHWNRRLLFAVPALAVITFLVSPPQIRSRFESLVRPRESDSNAFRLVVWRTGLRMIRAHPLLGLGPEGPHYHFDEWVAPDTPRPLPDGWYGHLHNIYLQYAAERGIPTMLVMMWLIGMTFMDFQRRIAKLPPGRSNRRFLLYGGIAVILATLTEGFVDYNLGDSEVLTMFLVVVACGYLALEPGLALD